MNNLVIKKILNFADRIIPDAEIYLYGSQARGEANKNSDWDLLILLNTDKISFAYETSLLDSFYEIELEIGTVLSPLIYSKNDWFTNYINSPLFIGIKNESIKLK